ncbi:hypothetical protein JTB14_002679 [Gonioctena quinquepunctata]|nr:hypothetical protein JTB14_002679 [Gonioctena quinquepunctata]
MNVIEMIFLEKNQDKTKIDRTKNETYMQELQIEPINIEMKEGRLTWFSDVCRMQNERLLKLYDHRETTKNMEPKKKRNGKEYYGILRTHRKNDVQVISDNEINILTPNGKKGMGIRLEGDYTLPTEVK